MKILFTGGSSFSGYWFVKELVKAGHQVTCMSTKTLDQYSGVRKQRMDQLAQLTTVVPNCSFGDDAFIDLINSESHWDLFCHHAADVTNYKSDDFDAARAVANNTHRLSLVLEQLKLKNCRKVLLTGSVFEQGEGAGAELHRAFSPYGLSKGLTADFFQYHTEKQGFRLGKFVIPNPFGPYEEARFTSFLVKSWYAGETPNVSMPVQVRDNIHVSLLAKAYVHFAERLTDTVGFERFNPSGYAESQGAFTERFARELRSRLGLPCELTLGVQTDFSEPPVRINTDVLHTLQLGWDEKQAWDELAEYYQSLFQTVSS